MNTCTCADGYLCPGCATPIGNQPDLRRHRVTKIQTDLSGERLEFIEILDDSGEY